MATLLGIVLAVSLAAAKASAGNVGASASINTVGQSEEINPGATASAYFPDAINPGAYAVSTRTSIQRWADGGDRVVNQQSAASGFSYTNFELWDLLGNTALDPAVAASLDLSFNYRFQGSTLVPEIALSSAAAGFLLQNYYGNTFVEAGGLLTVVFGPVPPFPSEGYTITGDTRLIGNYDFTISLPHEKSAGGQMYLSFQGSGGFKGVSSGTLSLESVTLAAGTMPSGGLGVRLQPTSQIVTVTAGPATTTINVPFGQITTQSQAGYPLLFGTIPVAKTGPGTLVLDAANTFSSSLAVNEGTTVAANVQALGTATLDVAAGAAFTISPAIGAANPLRVSELGEIAGTIDVNTGRFSLPASGASPAAELRSLLISGRSDGTWNGAAGIVSTAAAASGGTRTVGYVVSADGSAVVAFAASGDTNLDWQVDILDVGNLLATGRFDTGLPATWIEGDFGYDGVVDILDVAEFFATGLYDAGSYNAPAGNIAAVPEPSVTAFVAVGIGLLSLGVLRRKRVA